MLDGVITFRSAERARDADGVYRDGETTVRQTLARVESVNRAEFFAGGQMGFRPEYKFTLFHAEYRGEDELEYEGNRYAIYRTFRVPGTDDLELYAKLAVGVGHGQENSAG